MIRIFSKWWARLSYLFQLETEAAKNDINAAIAKLNAAEKRQLVAQLTAEADAIEANIKEYADRQDKGFWLCENGHEVDNEYRLHQSKPMPSCLTCDKAATLVKTSEMTGQAQYESSKERKEAETMAAEKRRLAEEESKNVSSAEQVAQVLSGRAQDSRAFANKIRQI